MKAANDKFFYNIKIDSLVKIKNIFWANASCRASYKDFSNVVTFDTTYRTNEYNMPLGMFVGVNHHLQSTVFVCALIRDESMESFVWIFETFLVVVSSTDLP
jgi:zinc finger SWIM domain-containing protein 3